MPKTESNIDFQLIVRPVNLPSPVTGTDGVNKNYVDFFTVTTVVDTSYTILVSDRVIVFNGSANSTFTLPVRVTGRHFYIKNKTNHILTINGAGNTIDGTSTLSLNKKYAAVLLIADSTEWGIF